MKELKIEQKGLEQVMEVNLTIKERIILNRSVWSDYYAESLSNQRVREISTGYVGVVDGDSVSYDGRVNHYQIKLEHQSHEDSQRTWLNIHELELNKLFKFLEMRLIFKSIFSCIVQSSIDKVS